MATPASQNDAIGIGVMGAFIVVGSFLPWVRAGIFRELSTWRTHSLSRLGNFLFPLEVLGVQECIDNPTAVSTVLGFKKG